MGHGICGGLIGCVEKAADGADCIFVGLPDLVFAHSGDAHGNLGIAELHAAFQNPFAGHMVGCQVCFGEQDFYGICVYAGTGQDGQICSCFLLKLFQKFDSFQAGRGLSGGQDGVDAQFFGLLQGFKGIPAHIEGTVKGNGHSVGGIHEFFIYSI